jgi:hypothetical protein
MGFRLSRSSKSRRCGYAAPPVEATLPCQKHKPILQSVTARCDAADIRNSGERECERRHDIRQSQAKSNTVLATGTEGAVKHRPPKNKTSLSEPAAKGTTRPKAFAFYGDCTQARSEQRQARKRKAGDPMAFRSGMLQPRSLGGLRGPARATLRGQWSSPGSQETNSRPSSDAAALSDPGHHGARGALGVLLR